MSVIFESLWTDTQTFKINSTEIQPTFQYILREFTPSNTSRPIKQPNSMPQTLFNNLSCHNQTCPLGTARRKETFATPQYVRQDRTAAHLKEETRPLYLETPNFLSLLSIFWMAWFLITFSDTLGHFMGSHIKLYSLLKSISSAQPLYCFTKDSEQTQHSSRVFCQGMAIARS